MCYKYATPKLKDLLDDYKIQPKYEIRDYVETYLADGFEHPFLAITTCHEPTIIQPARWGLIPNTVKNKAALEKAEANTLNAKCETVFSTWSYKDYIIPNRCLIWSNGFFESHWDDEKGKSKTPFFVYMPDKKPFTFGGIYTDWVDQDSGETFKTFSIITTPANKLLTEVHNNAKRMPLIIAEEDRDRWLGNLDKEGISGMMKPYTDGILKAHPVSKMANRPRIDKNIPEIQDEVRETLF